MPQLYREAGFWNLVELQQAVEEEKVAHDVDCNATCLTNTLIAADVATFTYETHQRRGEGDLVAAATQVGIALPPGNHKRAHLMARSWWKALDEAKKAAANAEAAKKKPEDWWTDTSYKGKAYLPLSTGLDKVVTKEGEKDAKPTSLLTWSLPPPRNKLDFERFA
jgi:hypothetical protein